MPLPVLVIVIIVGILVVSIGILAALHDLFARSPLPRLLSPWVESQIENETTEHRRPRRLQVRHR